MLSSVITRGRHFFAATKKVLVPTSAFVAVFLVAGFLTGSPVISELLASTGVTATFGETATATATEVNAVVSPVKIGYSIVGSVCDGATPKQYVIVRADPADAIYAIAVKGNGGTMRIYPNTTFSVVGNPDGIKYDIVYAFTSASLFQIDPSSELSFVAKGNCSLEHVATSTDTGAGGTGTVSTSTGTVSTSTVVNPKPEYAQPAYYAEAGYEVVVPPFVLPTDASEPTNVRTGVFPKIIKNDALVYSDVSGRVYFMTEAPSDQVRLFVGDASHWRSDLVFSPGHGLVKVGADNRYAAEFDTTKLVDGNYRLRGAFVYNNNWYFTDTLGFTVKNARPDVITITATTTPEKSRPASTSTYTPPYVPVAATATKSVEVKRAKPKINLVIDNRRITAASPTFDHEVVEVRVSSKPIVKVQFMVYSTDGAIVPAIRELGAGTRDELLTRGDNEVWTRLIDMSSLPTGSYRVFARVYYPREDQGVDSEPRTITVQHLSRPAEVGKFYGEKPQGEIAANVSAEAKESILRRVTDPSACASQEECAVFCASTPSATEKCAQFARAMVQLDKEEKKATRAAQEAAKKNLGAKIELHIPSTEAKVVVKELPDGKIATTTVAESTSTLVVIDNDGKTLDPTIRPSLADVIPESALKYVIDEKSQLSAELPAEARSVHGLQSYCGTSEHVEKCTRIIERLVPSASSVLAERADAIKKSDDQVLQIFEQRTGARAFVDSDGDGISDYDEVNIYHTDPHKRDTFGSGFSDGAALLGGNNPSKVAEQSTSSAMLVVGPNVSIENPKITGSTQKQLLSVANVSTLEVEKKADGKEDIKKMLVKGKAPANSFVRIFLFSEPIVITVKADENGDWSYVLDKTLPDGNHTAYTAIADASGKILAKSEPLPFVKTASAISVGEAAVAGAPSQRGIFPAFSPLAVLAIAIAMLGIALSVVGVVIGLRKTTP